MDWSILLTMVFTLFLIVDPIAVIPLIPEMMKNNSKKERKKMINRASLVAFLVLIFFTLVGRYFLKYFNVSIGAVRIAGGILLFWIGVEMLYGRISRTESSKTEHMEAIEKKDVSITPLAIPLLAGPGAIATVMMYSSIYPGTYGIMLLVVSLVIVMIASWILMLGAETLGKKLGGIGVKVIARVMGLLLVFAATQIFIEGLRVAGIIGTL